MKRYYFAAALLAVILLWLAAKNRSEPESHTLPIDPLATISSSQETIAPAKPEVKTLPPPSANQDAKPALKPVWQGIEAFDFPSPRVKHMVLSFAQFPRNEQQEKTRQKEVLAHATPILRQGQYWWRADTTIFLDGKSSEVTIFVKIYDALTNRGGNPLETLRSAEYLGWSVSAYFQIETEDTAKKPVVAGLGTLSNYIGRKGAQYWLPIIISSAKLRNRLLDFVFLPYPSPAKRQNLFYLEAKDPKWKSAPFFWQQSSREELETWQKEMLRKYPNLLEE